MRTLPRVGLFYAAVFCFLCLLSPSPAGASAPYVEEFSFVQDDVPFANCGDFIITESGAGTVRITTYFDRAGQPIRVLFQGRFKGTLTNLDTGAFLSDSPSVANITLDLIAGTQTNVGAFYNITVPGKGVVYFDVGRLVFDGFGPPVFIAGQHRPPGEALSILCEALR